MFFYALTAHTLPVVGGVVSGDSQYLAINRKLNYRNIVTESKSKIKNANDTTEQKKVKTRQKKTTYSRTEHGASHFDFNSNDLYKCISVDCV